MKRLLIISLSLLLLASCEKISIKNDLEDKWKIIWISGGITGSGTEPNFDYLNILNNKNYNIVRSGNVIEDGTYDIFKADDDWAGSYWRIEFQRTIREDPEAYLLSKGAFKFYANDTLAISDMMIDGYSWIFKRE